jgi:hypothetical protein
MRRPCSRLLSAIVIGNAGAIVVMGTDLLLYERIALQQQVSDIEVGSSNISGQDQNNASLERNKQAQNFETLASTAGVSSQARDNIWRALSVSAKHNGTVEKALIDLLKVAPTSGQHWVELAVSRSNRGVPISDILSLLQMSEITEPREQHTILLRMHLYLTLWDKLPYGTQRRLLDELASFDGRLDGESVQRLKLMLTETSQGTRKALKDNLVARKDINQAWLKALGL